MIYLYYNVEEERLLMLHGHMVQKRRLKGFLGNKVISVFVVVVTRS